MLSEWSETEMIMWSCMERGLVQSSHYIYRGFKAKGLVGNKHIMCFELVSSASRKVISFLLSGMQQPVVIWTLFLPHADAGVTRTNNCINMQPSCFRAIFTDPSTRDFLRKLNTKILFCMVQNKLHASKMFPFHFKHTLVAEKEDWLQERAYNEACRNIPVIIS